MWVSSVWKKVDLTGTVAKSARYKYLTKEASRLDMHSIPVDLQHTCLTFAQQLGKQGGPYMRTHSIRNRLVSYVNKLSKNKQYIEVLPEEVDEIEALPALMGYKDLRVVEVGFNRQREVCKIAFTTTLLTSNRVLFLCIGVDGGLKTFYVTPEFKWRAAYHCTDKTAVGELGATKTISG